MSRKGEVPMIDGRKVTMGELRHHVINAWRVCLGYEFDRDHVCTNRYGDRHEAHDLDELTLEHVPTVHGPADVRRDDPQHCVSLCSGLNVGAPSHVLREFLRTKLRERYPGPCTGGSR